jgi:two-component sensor histidine kinase
MKGFDWELSSKNGRRISVEASFNLLKDSEGNPKGFRGVVRDITDRKEKEKKIRNSLKEKEVLLGEIHHRVKNNLAVISGLLFLQAEKTENEAGRNLLQQSQGRINSMAIVHELLYENHNFSSIDPDKYIDQLILHISNNLSTAGQDITTNVTTDELQLDMNVAIPCALIINELLTNAYKYAFEDSGTGSIDISLTKAGKDYQLIVEDDGKGLPEDFDLEESGSGLGMFLVQTLARQIQGKLDISTEQGTRVAITFPVDQA